MAVQTVQEAFTEFEANTVRLPKKQADRAKSVHPEIRAAVRTHLDGLLIRDFLAGSFARHVQTVAVLHDELRRRGAGGWHLLLLGPVSLALRIGAAANGTGRNHVPYWDGQKGCVGGIDTG